jgi:preprotein translocase subunit SecA
MPINVFTQIFGSRNQRLLKGYSRLVAQANALEPTMQAASDDALREKTAELQQRCQGGESLEKLLPEAFAAVREASRRTPGCVTSASARRRDSPCIRARSRRCAPAKARRWSRR